MGRETLEKRTVCRDLVSVRCEMGFIGLKQSISGARSKLYLFDSSTFGGYSEM